MKAKTFCVSSSRERQVRPLEQCPSQNAEPDCDLVQPGGMLGRVMKDNPMPRIAHKRCPRLAIGQHAIFALRPQVDLQPRLRRHPTHPRRRAVDVEVVNDHMPAGGCGIARNQAPPICARKSPSVRLGPQAGTRIWPARHIAADNKRTGAMANIRKRATLHLPRSQWRARVFALQGLHPGQCIRADHPFACGRQRWRLVVQRADVLPLWCHTARRGQRSAKTESGAGADRFFSEACGMAGRNVSATKEYCWCRFPPLSLDSSIG